MKEFKLEFTGSLIDDPDHLPTSVLVYKVAESKFGALTQMYDKYDRLKDVKIEEVDKKW